MSRYLGQVSIAEGDGPRARPVEAADAVKHGRLAGTIWTDDGLDLSLTNVKGDAIQGKHETEAKGNGFD